MQRQALMFLALAAALAFGAAHAQDGGLAGVTMRVLDDVSGIDAVILELEVSRGEDEEAATVDIREAGAAAAADDEELGVEDRDVERPAVPPTPVP